MKALLYSCMISTIFVLACTGSKQIENRQGIEGKVIWEEGNMMPTIGQKAQKGKAVQRELHIYELTTRSQARLEKAYFYHDIKTNVVKIVSTDKQGKFKITLPEGRYSVFVKEEKGLFANLTDGEGNLQPVTVEEGKFTELILRVNYKAFY